MSKETIVKPFKVKGKEISETVSDGLSGFHFDFSRTTNIEIDKAFEGTNFREACDSIFKEAARRLAFEMDVELVVEAFKKAALYDGTQNPVTVEKHVREEEIRKFSAWLLGRIESERLRKGEIVEELRKYAKL